MELHDNLAPISKFCLDRVGGGLPQPVDFLVHLPVRLLTWFAAVPGGFPLRTLVETLLPTFRNLAVRLF
jgi:hypothetical protein